MQWTRNNPSPEYLKNVQLGRDFHSKSKTFTGRHVWQNYPILRRLCQQYQTQSIFDYGCGKLESLQARDIRLLNNPEDETKQVYVTWMDALGVNEYVGYDPCVPAYDTLPSRTFDAVLATDVLEYIVPSDMEWVVSEMFSFATQWLFVTGSCHGGSKSLADGTAAHKSSHMGPEWWVNMLYTCGKKYPSVYWEMRLEIEVAPITHRRFTGQGDQWEEKNAVWAIFKPAQLKELSEEQREQMLTEQRLKNKPITPERSHE